ncbi:MAG: Eco57I restriction-modification methylase domain-containing protein [Methanosarcinales archaeon]
MQLQKSGGIYYTPTYIVDYIVKNTLGVKLEELWIEVEKLFKDKKYESAIAKFKEINNIKVLDPACGSGSFLIKAFDLFDEYYKKYINKLKEIKEKEKSHFKTLVGVNNIPMEVANPNINYAKDILRNNLYGVDIDPAAAEIATVNLILKSLQKNGKLPKILGENIKVGNSLISDQKIAGKLAFDWHLEFAEVFANGGFDVVIGNPPYFNIQTLPESERLEYYAKSKRWSDFYRGQGDIHYYFTKTGIDFLKDKGLLGFITSRYWIEARDADKLREYILRNTSIKQIVDFENITVFSGASIHTSIQILQKGLHLNIVKFAHAGNYKDALEFLNNLNFVELDKEQLKSDRWYIVENDAMDIINKLLKENDPLSKLAIIGEGMTTGLNEVFVIDNLIAKEKRFEKELLRPLFKNSDIDRYRLHETNKLLI